MTPDERKTWLATRTPVEKAYCLANETFHESVRSLGTAAALLLMHTYSDLATAQPWTSEPMVDPAIGVNFLLTFKDGMQGKAFILHNGQVYGDESLTPRVKTKWSEQP